MRGEHNHQEIIFDVLELINKRPRPFEYYTASDLWTDEHTSEQMLSYHLNPDVDLSSRNAAFIDRSVEWIIARFEIGPGKKIADFGCGPGLYATRLARTSADVTGIDFSGRSLEYAREIAEKNGLDVNYVNQNYLEFDSDERFDLIIMIMCDFCVLSPEQSKKMLDKFQSLLRPGGSVLLDVYSLASFAQREEGADYEINQLNGFWSPNKYHGFQNTFKYEKEKVVLDKYTIIEADRSRTVYNWMRHYSLEALKQEFSKSGFTVVKAYANVAGDPFDPEGPEFAVVAKRS